ncbi:MAG: glycosyltransferase family 2 protein [Thermodesulfovibrionales bacterium]
MIPRISIVTPSFNQGRFIEETIKSVIGQEGEFHIDYIIVDGGSSDNTLEIIKKYDSMLRTRSWPVKCRGITYRWTSERDRGQADAIDKGFRLAEGEIVTWLNSDDTYLQGSIARVLGLFTTESGADVVYGRCHYIDEGGTVTGDYPTGPFDRRALATFNFVCQPATFFRREALEKAGGLDPDLRYVMDYDLWIRMSGRSKFLYLPEFLSTYRLHDISKTMSASDAVANQEECLKTVMRHYHWAPFNRVYGYCYQTVTRTWPSFSRVRLFAVLFSLFFAVAKYLRLNKKIKLDDLKMINPRNARKLFKDWIDINKESRP